jgi:RNA ligase (TIGR02306 family)
MALSTHKSEVVPFVMEKHPDADSLSIVKVWNFTCVVRTEDWLGTTKAVYITPDSVLPNLPEYRWLKDTPNLRKDREILAKKLAAEPESDLARIAYNEGIAALEARIDGNTKYLRIAAKRLRGVWSMGMLLPCPEGKEIGDDCAELLGITHYEPPPEPLFNASGRHQGADVGPPPPVPLAPKYDIESAYRYASEVFEPGEMVYVTEKLDGQNARFTMADDPFHGEILQQAKMYAGSRTEWKLEEGESNWWQVQKQNPWIPEWCDSNRNKLLYGENFGWVQKMRYGATVPGTLWFRAFDILDVTRWLDAEEFIAALPEDRRVPMLGIMPYNFEQLVKLADGKSLIPGASDQIREGIVIKPLKERYHQKLGRVVLKIVSNVYLAESAR